jgi:hypothetical protein
MRSRTSRRPPPSFLTRRGLRDNTPSRPSFLPRLERGLEGASLSLDGYAEAGISSHSCPSISRGLRKNGHKRVNMVRDSWASALDIGTGDDFKTAAATSEAGRARRLRAESPTFVVDGFEKSLNCALEVTVMKRQRLTSRRSQQCPLTGQAAHGAAFLPDLTSEVDRDSISLPGCPCSC